MSLLILFVKWIKRDSGASNANVSLTLLLQHIALYLQTQKANMLTTVYVRQKLWWIFFPYLLYILGVLFLFSHGEYELCYICISRVPVMSYHGE